MSGDGRGSEAHLSNGLDDKALLILSICFGILAFGGLALAVLLYSRLRQARRARMRGPRFALVDDDWQNVQAFNGGDSRRGSAGNMLAGSAAASSFAVGVGALAARRTNGQDSDEKTPSSGRSSAAGTHIHEKPPPSPDTSLGE